MARFYEVVASDGSGETLRFGATARGLGGIIAGNVLATALASSAIEGEGVDPNLCCPLVYQVPDTLLVLD